MIKSFGSATPEAFFIADFPSKRDSETGYALSGWAGNILRDFLKEQKLDLDNFWRSCLIKEAIQNETDVEQVKSLVSAQYGRLLIDEINDLKPSLLIPLGEFSFNFLTNLKNIRKFRGSVLPPVGAFELAQENTKVLPILGPEPYLRQEYRLRVVSRIDFSKIPRYLNRNPIPENQYNIWVARSATALRNFLNRAYEKCVREKNVLVFDIETYFQIPVCISFCFDGFESVCIPLIDPSIDLDNRALMVSMIDKVLRSPIPKVNQNIKYDWKILERWGFKVNNVVGDTMLAASALYCEFPKNLGFLTSIYTELPYFKDEGKEIEPDSPKKDRYYLYNAKDSLADHQIYTVQMDEVVELGVKDVYQNLMNVMPIYRKMEDRGLRVDDEQRTKLLAKYQTAFHIQEILARKLLNRDYFNPLSSKQVREVVFDDLGYEKVRGMKTTQNGEPSTDEESLELLLVNGEAKHAKILGPHLLKCVLAARKLHKVVEILELDLYPDGRFRCEWNLAGTENARTSTGVTTDQLIKIIGNKVKAINLGYPIQNLGKHGFFVDGETYGKDLRSMFVASPGFVLVECDLSGAEARVDRVLSGNFNLEIFEDPGIHKLTGSWLYGCSPYEIKKNILVDGVDRYHMAKTVRHAAERNMGPDMLAMLTQRPRKECNSILETFHQAEPAIREVFHKDVRKALDQNEHTLRAPNGRRRDFFDKIEKKTYNEAISFLPQAIVSDQTKFSGILKTFSTPGIYSWAALLAEQHDGTLAEVKKGREYEYASMYKKNIEEDKIDFRKCTLSRDYQLSIPCEVAFGENWYEMEEVKLELAK